MSRDEPWQKRAEAFHNAIRLDPRLREVIGRAREVRSDDHGGQAHLDADWCYIHGRWVPRGGPLRPLLTSEMIDAALRDGLSPHEIIVRAIVGVP